MAEFMEDLGQPAFGFFADIGSSVIIVETIVDDARGSHSPPPHCRWWRRGIRRRGSLRSYMLTDAIPQLQHNRGQRVEAACRGRFKAHHPTREAIRIADHVESVDICVLKHDASLLQLSNCLLQSGLLEGKMHGTLTSSSVEGIVEILIGFGPRLSGACVRDCTPGAEMHLRG